MHLVGASWLKRWTLDSVKFRSLLSWMHLVGAWRAPWTLTGRRGFDPCCRGCTSSGAADGLGRRRHRLVSILVVVDAPRRAELGAVAAADQRVSILVVVDAPRRAGVGE